MRLAACLLSAGFWLAGCASIEPAADPAVVPALLLGEQHDAPEHQQLHRQVVEALADRQLLAALVLEMAEAGRTARGLPADVPDQQVQQALGWRTEAWPWPTYGPAVMAAVRAGVPVLGSNLSAQQMRSAMADEQLERKVPAATFRSHQEAIRAGHCGLLPEAHVGPMARVQIARDRAMADVIAGATARGKTVVLLAGATHVNPDLGVPLHLPPRLHAQTVMLPPVPTGKDYCGELKEQLQHRKPKAG